MLKSGKRPVGWIAGVALAAMAAGVTGCSSDSGSDAEEKPAADSSASADSKKGDSNSTSDKKDGSAASQPSATRQSTAGAAVAAWVKAIIMDKPEQACLVMGERATDSSPAQVVSPNMCNGDTAKSQTMQESLGKFRESFTPKPPPSDPKVEVAQVPVNDGKAVFPADKVTVDGQTLDKIILSNSTGVEPGQMDVKMESSKINDAWYVTNFEFNFG